MSVRLGAIAWCLGAAWLQTRAVLPHALTWWSALFVTLGMCGVISYVAPTRMVRPVRIVLIVIAAFIAGVAWSAWRAETRLNDALDAQWENREIEIIGIVRGLPDEVIGFGGGRGVRFEFDVEHASSPARSVPSRVSLAWYPRTARGVTLDVPVVAPGERWRLRVKLRRPHGLYNPYGFDLEPWLLERNVRATGSVRASGEEVRLTAFVPSFESVVDRARFVVARHVMDALPNHPYAGVILALVVGDQRAVSADDWTMFNQTGVGHLLSISGLHVTMFAALVAALAAWCWTIAVRHRCAPLMRIARMPFAAVFGFIAAAGYTLISGMQVPAQRTLWMLGIVALGWIVQRQVRPSYLLALAAWIVIAADPWAVTAPGFWLSFIAVACLLYAGLGMMGGARPPWWQAAVHSQLAIAVLLSPVGLLLFQQTAVVGPIANAIAIPVVSFLVTPLALLGGLIGPWLEWTWPLQLAHALFAWTAIALEWLARVPGASLELP
ncbi:MAG TPA: ComEC/Rec2 family competence protein, partial [Burkholderiaceae bacterium]|nr:ComEC/Rec2 family competence protein [Burkholderiaceae bacterium]